MDTACVSSVGEMSVRDILDEACSRNIPLEIHYLNPESSARTINPETFYATSRLLGIDDRELYLDSPQRIGKEVHISQGTEVDIYFSFMGEVLSFRSRVTRRNCSVRLNQRMMVVGMCVRTPARISDGQRRTDYRITVAHLDQKIPIRVYETDPEVMTSCPLDGKVFQCQAINFSRGGLAMLAEGDARYDFRVNKNYFVAFTLPGQSREMVFLVEIRHVTELFDGQARKLGCMFYRWPDVMTFRGEIGRLNKFLVDIERQSLKRSQSR